MFWASDRLAKTEPPSPRKLMTSPKNSDLFSFDLISSEMIKSALLWQPLQSEKKGNGPRCVFGDSSTAHWRGAGPWGQRSRTARKITRAPQKHLANCTGPS